MSLLEDVRALGLPMGSHYAPWTFTRTDSNGAPEEVVRQSFVGWTTDEAKATAAQELGATIRAYRSSSKGPTRWDGYEVIVHEDVAA